MFCMLLRKHLSSGKITGITQPDGERILCFDIESYNELGDLTAKHLILELMGRHSNIILTNENMQVIDSVKHVDFTVSSVRQIKQSWTLWPESAQRLPGKPFTAQPDAATACAPN